MKSKIIFVGLCSTLLVLSCNRDNQINIEQAKNYVNEHAKYEKGNCPIAKSAKIKWDFNNTEIEMATRNFQQCVGQYLKDTIAYKHTGEGEIKPDQVSALCKEYYLCKESAETIDDTDKLYLNKTGIKIATTYHETNYDVSYTTQWDSECKILSSDSYIIVETYSIYRQFTFTY